VGKTTLARILGKALNCEHGPSAEPCGTCEPCAAIGSGTAVDYYEMDGASNRGIDAIRELTDAVKYQPASMRKKVYVIDEVHMLTTEAFNALLKTLEEPPPHVTFILATTEPHKVPVTILSRCQRYDFKLVPGARLGAHLRGIFERESFQVEPAAVDLLVRESGGSVRDALSLADQVISYAGGQEIREAQVAEVLGVADRALVRSLVEALARGDARAALEVVDAAVARGLDEVQVARALTRVLHDIAVAQVDARILAGSAEEQAELAQLGREIEPLRVRLMCDRMMRACEDLAESPEPRIVVDLALIDLAALDEVPPIGELVDRLVALERRLASGPAGAGGGGGGSRKPAPGRSAPRAAAPASTRAGGSAAPPPAAPASAAAVPAASPASPAASPASPAPLPASAAVPAASPAAPANGASGAQPAAPADPLRAWADVMTALEAARELTLLGWYEHAVVLRWDERGIELGFPAGAIVADMATEPRNVEALRAFLHRQLAAAVPLTVRILSESDRSAVESARSIVEAEADRRREETQRRSAEAREHPLTKMVLDTFGASIEEIKTDV
jgi:DNA polymerase-3 subunit gamma/tau